MLQDSSSTAYSVLRYVRRRPGHEALLRRWPGTADGFRVLTSLAGRD